MTPLSASVFWQLFGLTKEANSREASSSCQSSPFCSAFEGLAIPGGGGDAAFAELIFLDLAVLGRRQFLHEFEKARHGKIWQARFAEFDQVRRAEGLTGMKNDGGHDFVFRQLRTDREGRGIGDVWMAQQHLLDLER